MYSNTSAEVVIIASRCSNYHELVLRVWRAIYSPVTFPNKSTQLFTSQLNKPGVCSGIFLISLNDMYIYTDADARSNEIIELRKRTVNRVNEWETCRREETDKSLKSHIIFNRGCDRQNALQVINNRGNRDV